MIVLSWHLLEGRKDTRQQMQVDKIYTRRFMKLSLGKTNEGSKMF